MVKRIVKRTICALLCLLLAAGTGGCVFPLEAPRFSGTAETLSAGSPHKHYFDLLPETEKIAYNAVLSALFSAAVTFPECIEIPVLTRDELNEMYAALLHDNPELFFLSGESVMRLVRKRAYLYPDYRLSLAEYDEMYCRCREVASQIAEDARKETTAFDRERAVHDRLIAMCRYSDDTANAFRSTIYGVLCAGEAACEGYAKTAKFLLDLLEIPCIVVHGNSTPPGSRTESHMWNNVQLDGEWYHLDLTWDDPVLKSGGELIRYTYFNVTDDALKKTHTDYDAGHACSATKYNYFIHEDLLFTQFGEAETERAAVYAAQTITAGSDGFQLRFADKQSFANAQKLLFDEQSVYKLLQRIAELTDREFSTDRVSYFTTNDDHTIEIILES